MASGYKITYHPLEDGMVVQGEPLGVFTDIEGETFLVLATAVEVPVDETKATETAGSLEPTAPTP